MSTIHGFVGHVKIYSNEVISEYKIKTTKTATFLTTLNFQGIFGETIRELQRIFGGNFVPQFV
jgi:hypothetical protein